MSGIFVVNFGPQEENEVINNILKRLEVKNIKSSILLGFLTAVFHNRRNLPYYNEFLFNCEKVIRQEGGDIVADRTMKRFNGSF